MNTTPEELFTEMAYREGTSSPVPEMRRENESAAFNPEIGLRSEGIRSNPPSSSEIRLNLGGPAYFPEAQALRDDLSPLLRFSQRLDTFENVGEPRVEDYGHMYRRPNAVCGCMGSLF